MPVKTWITVIGAYLVFVGLLGLVRLASSLLLKSPASTLGPAISVGFVVLDVVAGVGLLRSLRWSWYVALTVQSAAIIYVLASFFFLSLPTLGAPAGGIGKVFVVAAILVIIPCVLPAWCVYYLLRRDARSLMLGGGESQAAS